MRNDDQKKLCNDDLKVTLFEYFFSLWNTVLNLCFMFYLWFSFWFSRVLFPSKKDIENIEPDYSEQVVKWSLPNGVSHITHVKGDNYKIKEKHWTNLL
jgi:hypothetical protein